ncbi:MAG: hypothetical protein GXP55_07420 [Deltaproteobacteria bacterium]|nr:hypothetical protein [Deltaproteobacteria bacterium]
MADCTNLMVNLGCSGGGDPTVNFATCEADLRSAMCIGNGPDRGLSSPASCNSM